MSAAGRFARTAVALTCGLIGCQRRRFVIAAAITAVIWALYAFFAELCAPRVESPDLSPLVLGCVPRGDGLR